MDLLGYAAFSGIERVAIIAGALIVGYWGYRLYGRDKAPGLIFMGIACVVLIASLATGGSHMRSVGASYQLAGAASGSEANGEPVVEVTPIAPEEVATPDPSEPSPFLDTRMDAAPTTAELSPQPADATLQTDSGEEQAEPSAMVSTEPEAAEPSAAPSPTEDSASEIALASSRELGGRIVSIKSENLTLEWSNEADDEAAQ
jgi:hypothetical protein